jgi:hypothetical protein
MLHNVTQGGGRLGRQNTSNALVMVPVHLTNAARHIDPIRKTGSSSFTGSDISSTLTHGVS